VLRALQEGVVTRIGATKSATVDVRVIAATNKTLEEEIGNGRFREDLYYRLNVVPIDVPPLRARKQDIPAMLERFVSDLAVYGGLKAKKFSEEAVAILGQRDWPGNVRELRNAVERLMILSGGTEVKAADVQHLSTGGADATVGRLVQCETFEEFKVEAERAFLTGKLEENDWNVSETARKLAMPRSNLYKKIDKYGLQRK
jgi:two-component system nitrogen regulation response regulator NtrX